MNNDFAASMRQAALSTRALNVGEATRIIQEALAGKGGAMPEAAVARPDSVTFPLPHLTKTADSPERHEAPPRLRKPLRVVLQTLRGLRSNQRNSFSSVVPVPDGAQFLERSFTAAAGTRPYKIYIPASASTRPHGLIVMLHGCTQNPDDFALGTNMNTVAERHGLIIAYPQQTQASNNLSCWNWFNPADQRHGAGEPSIIAGIAQEITAEFAICRSGSFVAGLSAGGAMASVMGELYPDVFAAVGIHSGLAYKSASDVMSAFAAMRGEPGPALTPRAATGTTPLVRTIVFHGSADRTVHPSNAKSIVAAATGQAGPGHETRIIQCSVNGRTCERTITDGADGKPIVESWIVSGAGHAWCGGRTTGSYTDALGPDASSEMTRFFLA